MPGIESETGKGGEVSEDKQKAPQMMKIKKSAVFLSGVLWGHHQVELRFDQNSMSGERGDRLARVSCGRFPQFPCPEISDLSNIRFQGRRRKAGKKQERKKKLTERKVAKNCFSMWLTSMESELEDSSNSLRQTAQGL